MKAAEPKNQAESTAGATKPTEGSRRPDRCANSAMVVHQGRFMRWLGRAFFGAVKFEEGNVEAIREAAAVGTPVYVINAHSRLDYLYFNYAFIKFGLPLVYFANEISMMLFKPVSEVFRLCCSRLLGRDGRKLSDRERMKSALEADKPCLVFLKRPMALTQWGAEYRISYLRDLIEIQEDNERPIVLIPLLLIWEQQPESYRRTVLDVIFGDPQAPGAIRKAVSFVRNFRHARAQVGKPINVRKFVNNNSDVTAADVLAARLKFAISEEFLRESRSIHGPVLKGRRGMVDEIMRTRPFVERIVQIGQSQGTGRAASEKKARQWLKNIAADFNFNWLEAFSLVLALVFHRRFTGIAVDTKGLARIREVGKDAPVILIPSRRSIMDYFAYSFVFYTHGLIPPHVAVREQRKLNIFKPVLRRTGAFFYRKRIKEYPLYESVLRQYVRKLIKEGYWLEFFIEGSRSRSGKLQPPHDELLSMVAWAVASGASQDAWLVPCSVTYERVVEGANFDRDRRGGKNGASRNAPLEYVLKRAREIGSRFGKLYMNFCEPISLKAYLESQGLKMPLEPGERVPARMVRRLGYNLMSDINRALVVTPQNLVAFVLMTSHCRGMTRAMLEEKVLDLVGRIQRCGGILSDPLIAAVSPAGRTTGNWHSVCLDDDGTVVTSAGGDVPAVAEIGEPAGPAFTALDALIEEVLGVLTREKAIELKGEGFDTVISVVERNRVWLEYYKNAIIHFFLPEAVLATAVEAVSDSGMIREDDLHNRAIELLRIFKYEFVYDKWVGMQKQQLRTLEAFLNDGVLVRESGGLRNPRDGRDLLNWYADILRTFVDSYRVLATVVAKSPQRQDRDDIINDAMKAGRKAWEIGEVEKIESVSPVIFKNALRFLREDVALERAPDIRSAAEHLLHMLPGTGR
jgi:glycerol-3-phosphate O-acyltransferase